MTDIVKGDELVSQLDVVAIAESQVLELEAQASKLKSESASEIEEILKQAKEFSDKADAIGALPMSPDRVAVVTERERRRRGCYKHNESLSKFK